MGEGDVLERSQNIDANVASEQGLSLLLLPIQESDRKRGLPKLQMGLWILRSKGKSKNGLKEK